ncbi:hypothetical protein C8F04DRAFT_1282112 [Mycena alexandri]|uniref:CxC2-like cysteine cluster KDZ transposase-associated domain-containing protein n=1 Tax=Mycena alexandri TaxID=1745969 RepID=A0AAD6RWH5_9AGAR|nr:hypothetical protein C8F04DRAFT_1282112 [Mycena alexandri]
MKQTGIRRAARVVARPKAQTQSRVATDVPSYTVTYYTDEPPRSEQHYVETASPQRVPTSEVPTDSPDEAASVPFMDASEEDLAAAPAYETIPPSKDKADDGRRSVAHMNEFREKEAIFLQLLLSLHYNSQVLTPCSCGKDKRVRKVACRDCLQAELLCRQCWLNKHRTMPTHWAFVWNQDEHFFEKTDICRVTLDTSIGLGHSGERCPRAEPAQLFTLVDNNGIHATKISFCQCQHDGNGKRLPEKEQHELGSGKLLDHYQQLTKVGIFPGSVKDPQTGYTVRLLDYYRQERSQGKGSAYNFALVLRRLADPFFADAVPNIYANFLAINRFYEYLQMVIQSGHAVGVDVPLPGEIDRPYPNRPIGFLGSICAACPERGVNMPLILKSPTPSYLRHLTAVFLTLDGNFKQNLFFKRDDGSDYGHVKRSGVVASACDHSVAGSFVDMLKGEAFALGTYAQREHLRHNNSPPHAPESTTPTVFSYDSWCSFVVNMVKRAMDQFPEEKWLHTLLNEVEGQIPADHINGHGVDCQAVWQAVYFACRAHFHGETAEVLWAFLNPLGSSTRQMTGGARHDIINIVIDAWNSGKIIRQAELSADERMEALRLFELHMAVVEDLSRQHAAEVAGWSQIPRGSSVYQHDKTKVLTIENVLDSMIAEERERIRREDANRPKASLAQWIHDGIGIQRQQILLITLLKSHKEHPLQDTWDTITKLRDVVNAELKTFRERQVEVYPRLRLSGLDVDEPELTAIQLPSYRMKHRQRSVDAGGEDAALREAEIKLRCSQADNGILAVQGACLALSAVKKARELDYRGQNGVTRSQRNREKAELMRKYEMIMYNTARAALIDLGHMKQDAVDPYPPLNNEDTRRKETHLSRATGDSRLFDGTAWYLQSGEKISRAAMDSKSKSSAALASRLGPEESELDNDDRLMAGTQTLKRAGPTHQGRNAKRLKDLKDILPDNVDMESPSSSSEAEESDPEMAATTTRKKKQKSTKKKPDGWIWLQSMTRGQKLGDGKLKDYKEESDRVQWFRAEAEMYRWLEQYERKHAEGFRVIERFRRDSTVWAGLAEREEKRNGGVNGASTFARMRAAMCSRLAHNADVIFKKTSLGAHYDWVSSSSFDELITKIDGWPELVFKWMDDMNIHRVYKDF